MKPSPNVTYQLVDTIPAALEYGVVYISQRYRTASHLCICGCGLEAVTQLAADGWRFHIDRHGRLSMNPSIGNWSFPCRSHYVIRSGAILWANDYTREMVAGARQADNPRAHAKRGFFQSIHNAASWIASLFK